MSDNILFPPPAERASRADALSARLAAAAERVSQGGVTPDFDSNSFAVALAGFDFARPVPFDDLLAWTVAQMEHGLVHVTHPRYFGLYNPAPTFPALCADRIAAAFNPQLASHATSPAAVAIEAHVIRAVARRAGLAAEAGGHFTAGGSEANFTALICALTQAEPGFAGAGSRAFKGPPVFYVSRDSHLAWIKLAHMAGLGRAAARFVPTDGTGRMDPAALREAIETDRRADCVPVMVVATAGTTNAGMIDPLVPCRAIASEVGAWFHVDAAWGGAAIASPRLGFLLAGIEAADSATIDAHKWFATTMGCGMFLTSRPQVLSDAFNVSASFMPSHALTLDPYMTTAQWSRRFLGLRLFLSLAAGGWNAYAAHVETSVALAQDLAGCATAGGWKVANESRLAVVCLVPPPGSAPVHSIVQRVLKTGAAWVSAAQLEGKDVIRCCVTHGETTPSDIAAVMDLLEDARQSTAAREPLAVEF